MSRLIASNNRTWIPLTDDEIERQIEFAKAVNNNNKSEPRPLSLVKFADDSSFRKEYLIDSEGNNNTDYESSCYGNMIYLGAIPNQLGYGVYLNIKTNSFNVVDIEELVEKTEDEL